MQRRLDHPLAGVTVGVQADRFAHLPAEELVNRLLEDLSGGIPQREFDSTDRDGAHPLLGAAPGEALAHKVVEPFDVERVLVAENRLQVVGDHLVNTGGGVGLADPRDAGVGFDLHDRPLEIAIDDDRREVGNRRRHRGPLGRSIEVRPHGGSQPRREIRVHGTVSRFLSVIMNLPPGTGFEAGGTDRNRPAAAAMRLLRSVGDNLSRVQHAVRIQGLLDRSHEVNRRPVLAGHELPLPESDAVLASSAAAQFERLRHNAFV